MLIGFATFAVAVALHRRLRGRRTAMVWLVIALLGVGRFLEFFVRSDSETGAFGLETAQWTSIALILVALVGLAVTLRKRPRIWSSRT